MAGRIKQQIVKSFEIFNIVKYILRSQLLQGSKFGKKKKKERKKYRRITEVCEETFVSTGAFVSFFDSRILPSFYFNSLSRSCGGINPWTCSRRTAAENRVNRPFEKYAFKHRVLLYIENDNKSAHRKSCDMRPFARRKKVSLGQKAFPTSHFRLTLRLHFPFLKQGRGP